MSPLCWCKLKKCAEGRPNKAMAIAYLYKNQYSKTLGFAHFGGRFEAVRASRLVTGLRRRASLGAIS